MLPRLALPASLVVQHVCFLSSGCRLWLPLHQRFHAPEAARQGHPRVSRLPARLPAGGRAGRAGLPPAACRAGPRVNRPGFITAHRPHPPARLLGCPPLPRRFQDAPPTTVFLLSMRSGSVGINLTAASHVFLMVRAALGCFSTGSCLALLRLLLGSCLARPTTHHQLPRAPCIRPSNNVAPNPPPLLPPAPRPGAGAEPGAGGAGHWARVAHGPAARGDDQGARGWLGAGWGAQSRGNCYSKGAESGHACRRACHITPACRPHPHPALAPATCTATCAEVLRQGQR